jgi:hypothetical protein
MLPVRSINGDAPIHDIWVFVGELKPIQEWSLGWTLFMNTDWRQFGISTLQRKFRFKHWSCWLWIIRLKLHFLHWSTRYYKPILLSGEDKREVVNHVWLCAGTFETNNFIPGRHLNVIILSNPNIFRVILIKLQREKGVIVPVIELNSCNPQLITLLCSNKPNFFRRVEGNGMELIVDMWASSLQKIGWNTISEDQLYTC